MNKNKSFCREEILLLLLASGFFLLWEYCSFIRENTILSKFLQKFKNSLLTTFYDELQLWDRL